MQFAEMIPSIIKRHPTIFFGNEAELVGDLVKFFLYD